VTVSGLCRQAGITRQAYYQERKERESQVVDEAAVVQRVRRERAQQPRLGARKLYHMLKEELQQAGIELGRDRFFAVLGRHGLLLERRPKKVRTTYHDEALPVYRNLLYERAPTQAHQVWVSDLTYVQTQEGCLYLSVITDLHSRKIVGWNVGETLVAAESIKALHQALAQLPPGCWPIHHSDRGCQYCSHEYVEQLQRSGLSISMTEANHCYENCYAERVNGILKGEYFLDMQFRTKAQARRAIEQAIYQYNHRRPHCALKMRTPCAVHCGQN